MPTKKKTKPKKKPSNNLGPKKKTLFDHINHIREKKNEKYFEAPKFFKISIYPDFISILSRFYPKSGV